MGYGDLRPGGLRLLGAFAVTALIAAVPIALADGGGTDSATAGKSATTEPTHNQAVAKFIRADFKRADRDGDKVLGSRELVAEIHRDFRDFDLDRNGKLTLADIRMELQSAGGEPPNHSLAYYFDFKGKVKAIKFPAYLKNIRRRWIRPMDANSDGKIKLAEAIRYHQQVDAPRR